jgi:hypothetical protein
MKNKYVRFQFYILSYKSYIAIVLENAATTNALLVKLQNRKP